MPFRGSGSEGGKRELLRAKPNLPFAIPSPFCWDGTGQHEALGVPESPQSPLPFVAFSTLQDQAPLLQFRKGYLLSAWKVGLEHILAEINLSLDCDLWLSFYMKFKEFLGCWRCYPEPKDLMPCKWVGTRHGNADSTIDNAYLGLWKHYKQRKKFLLPLQL